MKKYTEGSYLGVNEFQFDVHEILLSKTVYPEGYSSGWHYHENPHFAFVLKGGSIETRKTRSLDGLSGACFFYNAEEPHQNTGYRAGSVNFNIELKKDFLTLVDFDVDRAKSPFMLTGADCKFILLKIIKETQINDRHSAETIKSLTIQLFGSLMGKPLKTDNSRWAAQLKELLHEEAADNYSLNELSSILGVHPVTISKYFPLYFDCTLGEYMRKVKVERALALIRSNDLSLTEIAYECGFSDQSHFIRTFKTYTGMLPKEYRAI